MGWLGKLVGGTIGFAMGGPLGAIAGAALGHAFDSNADSYYPEQQTRLSDGEEAQFTFFVAAFSMLAKLVRTDGGISKAEINSIEEFMTQDLNLSPGSRRIAVDLFNTALNSPQSFQDFALQFYGQFQHQPQILELMIDILLRVSVADGSLNAAEEALIRSAVNIFHFSEESYRKLKSKYVRDASKHYATLGCDPGDADDHLKSQYRKLVRDYHPDTIAAKGLPEEFTKFAQDKFREIQEAYEAIKRERGLK